ncbi:hypothetical protein ATE84_2310 [Aquimarina sp. MAR_2010_214]|uniref:hypothetical protein n=1 Tax=Aquimarina sp. MAR_2010_214 TaxID=1250026 RepID=UPI000C7083C5|nr:hypothetical protein [Aquimarina sp. MAR_2010_214]PKV50255.1 hypothetical protein ATE84_2310 [Aquimarina sp. MAR_2010_214]
MNEQKKIEQEIVEKQDHLKHLLFEEVNDAYIVSLNDSSGYAVVKGYGNTVIDAINDLHSGLI